MRRLTIVIRDDTPDDVAMRRVTNVIDQGRISRGGKAYCFCTSWTDGIVVCSDVTRAGNDTFHVYREVTQ